jgi:tRNA U34 5-carboxymethylaminomethyl modifying enzyme MnmG/GidA
MEFFKKRIRQFQEKKLDEILSKIQFHQYMKNQAEQKLEEMTHDKTKIREEISFNEKMIEI